MLAISPHVLTRARPADDTHPTPEAVFLADRVLVMTARPGRIMDDVRIELARPRPLDMVNTAEFGDYVRRIRAQFATKGGLE